MSTGLRQRKMINRSIDEREQESFTGSAEKESKSDEGVKTKWYLKWKNWLKILIILLIIIAIILAIIYREETAKVLTDFLEWMERNPVIGSFAFIAVYWFATVCFIPGSILTLGAGFIFRLIIIICSSLLSLLYIIIMTHKLYI